MTFGSRPKGSKAELEVAAMLQAWWEPYSPGSIFKRVPLSGGWGDPNARAKFRSAGDVMTSCSRFPFSVEIKRRENWSWQNVIEGKRSPVWKWWRQAVGQAKEMDAQPLLWFRKNREPWKIMLWEGFYWDIGLRCAIDGGMRFSSRSSAVNYLQHRLDKRKIDYGNISPMIIAAESFLAYPPGEWVSACERAQGRKTDGG